jgi:hypothetical protein
MEELNNNEKEALETQSAKEKTPKDKKIKEKIEVGGLKIQVPSHISQKIIDLQNQLKERGYMGKMDDILSTMWDQVTSDWCEARLEALTPDEYYLNAIKNLPDVRQKIVDQAKKALIKAREDGSKGNA